MTEQFVEDAIAYADRIADHPERASFHARLAAQRFLDDLDAARSSNSQWEFRPDLARRAMLFATRMPNIKGPEAGKPLRLMDWQKLVYANIFGFVFRGTSTRRFRQGCVFVPKGNGKTTVAAPLGLYLTFGEGEGGAEGYTAAVTRDQALILFEMAQNMVRRSSEIRDRWGVGVLTKAIFQDRTASKFVPISSDAKSLDGLNVQVAICDEIGSHRTSEVYDALLTAMGKRRQPFLFSISTATGNTAGIGKKVYDYGMRVLQQSQVDDRFFAITYSIDEGDDPWSEATWIKANPGWGQSVQPDAIRAIMRQARNNPSQEAAARTRHLNMWIGADEALFSMRAWLACADRELNIADYAYMPCHIGLDLASKTDLAAVALVFPDGKYIAFCRCYTNEAAVLEARNASYPGWAANGELIITPGDETDFGWIENDILRLCADYKVECVAYDPWAATQLAQRLSAEGVPMVEFRSSVANFSEATKELDAAMRAGRVKHDGNGPLTWCIGNVVGHEDARGNIYPKKPRPENKIDAAVAVIMALARSMTAPGPSVYESRGLLVLGG